MLIIRLTAWERVFTLVRLSSLGRNTINLLIISALSVTLRRTGFSLRRRQPVHARR